MKNLFNIINQFIKFAKIPVYNKCKKCGDASPDLNEDDLCYKCFDPSKSKDLSSKEIKTKKPISNVSFPLELLAPASSFAFIPSICHIEKLELIKDALFIIFTIKTKNNIIKTEAEFFDSSASDILEEYINGSQVQDITSGSEFNELLNPNTNKNEESALWLCNEFDSIYLIIETYFKKFHNLFLNEGNPMNDILNAAPSNGIFV